MSRWADVLAQDRGVENGSRCARALRPLTVRHDVKRIPSSLEQVRHHFAETPLPSATRMRTCEPSAASSIGLRRSPTLSPAWGLLPARCIAVQIATMRPIATLIRQAPRAFGAKRASD
jgi:hypothetical protein